MDLNHLKSQAMDKALWRYGIIAPLLHRQPDEISQDALLFKLAGESWHHWDRRQVKLSPETLRKWLYRYRKGGLPALCDQQRLDKGQFRIPHQLVEAIHEYRQAHPRITTQLLLHEMIRLKLWNGNKPSRSALYRFIKAHNLGRDPHRETKGVRAFAYEDFGQLWTADFLHGPKLRVGRNKRKTSQGFDTF